MMVRDTHSDFGLQLYSAEFASPYDNMAIELLTLAIEHFKERAAEYGLK